MPAYAPSVSSSAIPEKQETVLPIPLFDANVSLGRSGQRQPMAFIDAPGLREVMASHGIERVLVYHAAAVRGDVVAANRRLLVDIEGEPDVEPCWVLLPPSTLEMGNPEELVDELLSSGVRCVRIFPRVHNYQVRLRVLGGLLSHLSEWRIPVFIDFDIVHWSERYIDWDGIDEICTAFPELPVILVRPGLMVDRDLYALLENHPNLYLETSYYFAHQGLRALASRFGAQRMIFGSGMPTYAPGAAIATLTYSGLSRHDQELVGSKNLMRLLQGVCQ